MYKKKNFQRTCLVESDLLNLFTGIFCDKYSYRGNEQINNIQNIYENKVALCGRL